MTVWRDNYTNALGTIAFARVGSREEGIDPGFPGSMAHQCTSPPEWLEGLYENIPDRCQHVAPMRAVAHSLFL